ncbi:unnamed protein product [Calypogeia fissa]
MTPGQDTLVILYSEDLNTTVPKFQNTIFTNLRTSNSLGLYDFDFYNPMGQNFSYGDVTMLQVPFFFGGSDSINVTMTLCSVDPMASLSCLNPDGRLPSINAVEVYGQYNYNFSETSQDDDQIITVLKGVFSLTNWQGDPCVPVPQDWLSCSLSPSQQIPSYYVTSIKLSHREINGSANVTAATPDIRLNGLTKMSITNSQVDDATFQLLMDYSSPVLSVLNLSYNALTSLPTPWENTASSLVVLDLSHNQLQGQASSLDTWVQRNSRSLQELYVNANNVGGTFSSTLYFSSLPNLTTANFDQNSIQGTLDLTAWYATLQEVTNNTPNKLGTPAVTLQLFSFVNNSITNIIPSVETFGSAVQDLLLQNKHQGILLGGNPYCNDAKLYIHQYLCRSTINEDIREDNGSNKTGLIAGMSIGAGILLLLSCTVFSITLWRLWKQVLTLREIQKALADRQVQPPLFQYSDLKNATRDFHKDSKLGSGGFGIVYKGVLADQTAVAVKKLFDSQSMQVLDDFLNEVMLITGIKHRNLIQLKGCCINDKQRILIYEYAEKGNLAETLWGSKAHKRLSWEMCLTICLRIARGLSYLHEELQPSIIHRDIKPQNILLDKDFNPKIADFGLARHFSGEISEARHYTQISKIAGTRGYIAPEYALHGQLSSKTDVYSYGILVMEVICRRKCIDSSLPIEERVLKDWVRNKRNEGSLHEIFQPEFSELPHNCAEAEIVRALDIGLLCTQYCPERRPSMSQVVAMFLGRMEVEVLDEFDQVPFNSVKDNTLEWSSFQSMDEESAVFPLIEIPLLDVDTLSDSMATQVVELSSGR